MDYQWTTTLWTKLGALDLNTETVKALADVIKATLDVYEDGFSNENDWEALQLQVDALCDLADALGFVTGPSDNGSEWRVEPKAFADQTDFEEVE